MKKLLLALLVVLLVLPVGVLAEEYGWTNGAFVLGGSGITLHIPEGMVAAEPEEGRLLHTQASSPNNEFYSLHAWASDETDIDSLKQDFVNQNYEGMKSSFPRASTLLDRDGNPGISDGSLLLTDTMFMGLWGTKYHFFSNQIKIGDMSIPYIAYNFYLGSQVNTVISYSVVYFIPDGDKTYIVECLLNMTDDVAAAYTQKIRDESDKSMNDWEPLHHNYVTQVAEAIFAVN